jgi:hypothetical protein
MISFDYNAVMSSFDVHQHLWSEEVLCALSRRHAPPFARWQNATWEVQPASEPPFDVNPRDHDPEKRAELLAALGVDNALVGLSSPVGIEGLPPAEAEPLLEAWEATCTALPSQLRPWAALAVSDPDPLRLEAALDAGAVGLCLPAGALSQPRSLERLGPLLERLEWRNAPLFVHPGPASGWASSTAAWWGPCTTYLAELHAAWHAFMAWGRPRHPALRVLFAALAGLAPVHAERTALRGGPTRAEPDPLTFYDTSSYGPRALRAIAAEIGHGQLVYGTDTPVVTAPPLDISVQHQILASDNARRLLGLAWVAA